MLSWDRTHDWVVRRQFHERTRLTIRFSNGSPTAAELLALRRCLPRFRDTAPGDLRALLGTGGTLELGEMWTPDAREMMQAAAAEGLHVVPNGASFFSYLPYDRTTGHAWLIEDEAEAVAVAEEMIAAGVPIQDATE